MEKKAKAEAKRSRRTQRKEEDDGINPMDRIEPMHVEPDDDDDVRN